MSYLEPYKISDINLNKIVYSKIKETKNKKIIIIKYNDNNKFNEFVFQLPTLLNINKAEIFNEYSEIDISLIGKDNTKINNIIDFFNNLELKIKEDAHNNAHTWFKNNNDTINFQKIIRNQNLISNNIKSQGTLKLKLIKTQDFESIIQLNNKRIDAVNIPEDSWCKMILECYAIWINSNNDFGIFFRPIIVSFTPKENLNYKYTFSKDSENSSEFDIPDTDINDSIFMKTNINSNNQLDETTQIDYNNLINHLENNNNNNNNNNVSVNSILNNLSNSSENNSEYSTNASS